VIPALLEKHTAAMTALAALPPARNPCEHTGCMPKIAACAANIEAFLGQIVSIINGTQCKHYKNRSGVWVLCVLVKGYFYSSCVNCHYNNKGICCSLCKFSA
jgi:hypothetical protein